MNIISIFLTCLCILNFFNCGAKNHEKDSVYRIEIHYLDFWYMTLNPPATCEDLLSGEFSTNTVIIKDSLEIEKWTKAIDNLSLIKWEDAIFKGDCRICCAFYTSDNKLCKTIALWPTGLKIGDTLYDRDSTFLKFIETYLRYGYFTFSGEKLD